MALFCIVSPPVLPLVSSEASSPLAGVKIRQAAGTGPAHCPPGGREWKLWAPLQEGVPRESNLVSPKRSIEDLRETTEQKAYGPAVSQD